MELNVVIAGAGIGGLTASIALRRAGHKVTIYEQSNFKSEVGAAITITPNGARILDGWGFDFKKARVTESNYMHTVTGSSLDTMKQNDFQRIKQRFGYGMAHYHRVDLHRELLRLAESAGVQIELGSSVEHVKSNGEIEVRNKGNLKADLVVIAEGIHSKHISQVTGKDEPLTYHGRSIIRALVPQDKIRSNSTVAPYFDQQTPNWFVPMTMPPESTIMITYPCRDNEILNVAVVHHTMAGYEDREDWHSPITLEDAKKAIKNFHPACHELLGLADNTTIYALTRREPLPNFVNDRLILIGDAAHAMPPTHAQGAVITIEESCALGLYLSKIDSPGQIPERLKMYEKHVKPRTQTVQLLSLALPVDNDPYRERAQQLWEGGGWGKLFPVSTELISYDMETFFYNYDMKAETERVLHKAGIEL